MEKLQEILLKNAESEDVVAYTADGKTLNREEYKAKIQRGINDIKSGNYTLDEDFAREIETW